MSNIHQLIYAGIGARATPLVVLDQMTSIGDQLAHSNWLLRSGHAPGADQAFGRGAEKVGCSYEMFLPWKGFNGAPRDNPDFIVPAFTAEMLYIAELAYNADDEVRNELKVRWHDLKDTTKKLMARNVCQILGANMLTPADMVVCWTPMGRAIGGTGTAIRVAQRFNIPVFNLAIAADTHDLCRFVENMESLRAWSGQ